MWHMQAQSFAEEVLSAWTLPYKATKPEAIIRPSIMMDMGCQEKYIPFDLVGENSGLLHLTFGYSAKTTDNRWTCSLN